MELDPRIKVNPDGSYFYSGSVLTGTGNQYHSGNDDEFDHIIADKRQSKVNVFRTGQIDLEDTTRFERVDTTVPGITFKRGLARDNSFRRIICVDSGNRSERVLEDVAKLIFFEWCLLKNKAVNIVNKTSTRGLILDRLYYHDHPRGITYNHFELTYNKTDTRRRDLKIYYRRACVGAIRVNILNESEAGVLVDEQREVWETQFPEFPFPVYRQSKSAIHSLNIDTPDRIVKLLQKTYIEGDTGWHLIDGYHCKVVGYVLPNYKQ